MGYYCKLHFKEVKSAEDFLLEVEKTKKALGQLNLKIINDNIASFNAGSNSNDELTMFKIDTWLRKLFSVTFLYYPQFNLMAYQGEGRVKGFHAIEFQDFSDQNHVFPIYPKDIGYFDTKVKNIHSVNEDTLKRLYVQFFDTQQLPSRDFAECAVCYRMIESELGMRKFLREVPQFEVPFHELMTTSVCDPVEWKNFMCYVKNTIIKNK